MKAILAPPAYTLSRWRHPHCICPGRHFSHLHPSPPSKFAVRRCLCTLSAQANGSDEDPPFSVHSQVGKTAIAVLIERQFAELAIKQVAEQVGGIRTRQHTNPLKASLMAPVPPPKWEDIFPDPSLPLMVDIGCGSGRFLMMMAKRSMGSCNFLGLDIRYQLVSRAKRWAEALQLRNLDFMVANATVSFGSILSTYPGSLTSVTILCPDPHFKVRHHKRRIVQRPLVDAIVDALAPGGKVLLQSDVKEVAVDMKHHFDTQEGVSLTCEVNVNPSIHDEDGWLIENPLGLRTEREIHALSTGGKIYRVSYTRL